MVSATARLVAQMAGAAGSSCNRSYETLDPTEVRRESVRLPQGDIKHRRTSTIRCLELHMDDSTGAIQKLRTNYKLHRVLSSGQRLTEKSPVAQTLSFLNADVRTITLKVTFCP